MNRSKLAFVTLFGGALLSTVFVGCSDDEDGTNGDAAGAGAGGAAEGGGAGDAGAGAKSAGGSGNGGTGGRGGGAGRGGLGGDGGFAGGTAGEGGAGGASGGTGGANAGAAGEGGTSAGAAGEGGTSAGSGGAGGAGGSPEGGAGGEGGGTHCAPSPPLTKPTVPVELQVTESAVLVTAHYAEGAQTYTCEATVVVGGATTYAWSAASVPAATLYDSNCLQAGTHFGGPRWRANDLSTILGVRVRGVASPTAGSIPLLLLSATSESGFGLFTSVTAIQRLATVGGVAPTSGCDVLNVARTVAVPYTAVYYFYSGSNTIPPAPAP